MKGAACEDKVRPETGVQEICRAKIYCHEGGLAWHSCTSKTDLLLEHRPLPAVRLKLKPSLNTNLVKLGVAFEKYSLKGYLISNVSSVKSRASKKYRPVEECCLADNQTVEDRVRIELRSGKYKMSIDLEGMKTCK